MKRTVLCIAVTALLSGAVWAQDVVDISFDYKSQSGFASNQFAVWIEDAAGSYVKTLYATRFTAKGGWKKRPNSIPVWVKKSGLAALDKKAVDTLTGATPRGGRLSYTWDGTDMNGKKAAGGEYRVILEATLRNDNQVLYSTTVQPGTAKTVELSPTYSGPSDKEHGMIGNVVVTVR